MLFTQLTLPLIYTADAQILHGQQTAMEKLVQSDTTMATSFDKLHTHPGGSIHDCCTWLGVECTGGIVTEMVLPHCFITLDLRFLPPTLRFFHHRERYLNVTYSVRFLPRDLRYMYIRSVSLYNVGSSIDKGVFDAAYLPTHSEEIHICFRVQLWSTVIISKIPPNLRFLHIGCSPSVEKIVVDNTKLPPGLISLRVFKDAQDAKVKVLTLNGKKPDPRVRAYHREQLLYKRDKAPMELIDGKYLRSFDAKWEALSRGIGVAQRSLDFLLEECRH